MQFIIDFGLLALLVIVATAFLGYISYKVVGLFVRKNKKVSFELNELSKKGWKKVERH